MNELTAAWLVLLASGLAAFTSAQRPRPSAALGSAGAPLAALAVVAALAWASLTGGSPQ